MRQEGREEEDSKLVNMDVNYTEFKRSKNDFSNDYEEGNACRM